MLVGPMSEALAEERVRRSLMLELRLSCSYWMQEFGDVVVAVRQRYCNPASTPAVLEIPSSAAWTMRKMKKAAAAANAIRTRAK